MMIFIKGKNSDFLLIVENIWKTKTTSDEYSSKT